MTLNGAIMELVMLSEHPMMPVIFKPNIQKIIETVSECEEPERKTGRWVEMGKNEDGTHNLCCGVCGKFKFKSKGHANSQYTKKRYKFCGGCGAKMEGAQDAD